MTAPELATVLVGSHQGLWLIRAGESSTTTTVVQLISDECITSIASIDGATRAFITTRSGKVLQWDGGGVSFLADLAFRLWFVAPRPNGELVFGGTARKLVQVGEDHWSKPVEDHSLAALAASEAWRSHSGGTAHVNSYVETPAGDIFVAAEVGGVARRESDDRWLPLSEGLDRDVHRIVPGEPDLELYATTGTGLFWKAPHDREWSLISRLPLPYAQGLAYRRSDRTLFVSAAAAPFGRRKTGPYGGTNRQNQFGIFHLTPPGSWQAMQVHSDPPAGVLSKALAINGDRSHEVFAGDLAGRLLMSTDDMHFRPVATGLGPIECVATLTS